MNYRYWTFKQWLKKYTVNVYKNLSVLWSKREQKLQRSLQATHEQIGSVLIKTTDGVYWGDETDSGDEIRDVSSLEPSKLYST